MSILIRGGIIVNGDSSSRADLRVRGINRMAISRGDVVSEESKLSAPEGRGEYLPRSASPRAA